MAASRASSSSSSNKVQRYTAFLNGQTIESLYSEAQRCDNGTKDEIENALIYYHLVLKKSGRYVSRPLNGYRSTVKTAIARFVGIIETTGHECFSNNTLLIIAESYLYGYGNLVQEIDDPKSHDLIAGKTNYEEALRWYFKLLARNHKHEMAIEGINKVCIKKHDDNTDSTTPMTKTMLIELAYQIKEFNIAQVLSLDVQPYSLEAKIATRLAFERNNFSLLREMAEKGLICLWHVEGENYDYVYNLLIPHLLDYLKAEDFLIQAARLGNIGLIDACLAQFGTLDINALDREGNAAITTAIHYVPRIRIVDFIRQLLQRGAHPKITRGDGKTALHLAIEAINIKLIECLLADPRTKINSGDIHGNTPLHSAAKILTFRKEVATMLLAVQESELDWVNATGDSPLMLAIKEGNLDMAAALLAHRASVSVFDHDGFFPLHRAAQAGHGRVIKLLLSYGVDVNQKNKQGDTALHLAIRHEREQAAMELLLHGADVLISNDANDCARSYAAEIVNYFDQQFQQISQRVQNIVKKPEKFKHRTVWRACNRLADCLKDNSSKSVYNTLQNWYANEDKRLFIGPMGRPTSFRLFILTLVQKSPAPHILIELPVPPVMQRPKEKSSSNASSSIFRPSDSSTRAASSSSAQNSGKDNHSFFSTMAINAHSADSSSDDDNLLSRDVVYIEVSDSGKKCEVITYDSFTEILNLSEYDSGSDESSSSDSEKDDHNNSVPLVSPKK